MILGRQLDLISRAHPSASLQVDIDDTGISILVPPCTTYSYY